MTGLPDMIPSDLVPHGVDHLKAKSLDRSSDPTVQDTLALHTWQVLCRLADQYRLRGNLSERAGDNRLWHRLYWGCFLHDFGKAAVEFQERLAAPKAPKNTWSRERHRHEVLSLAFIDWLFPPGHPDRLAVIGVICGHHRDFADEHIQKYGAGNRSDRKLKRIDYLINQIEDPQPLWDWLDAFGYRWCERLGMSDAVKPMEPANREAFGAGAIIGALDDLNDFLTGSPFGIEDQSVTMRAMLARGLILTADHAASAGTGTISGLHLTREAVLKPLEEKLGNPPELSCHQTEAEQPGAGSTILVAPTGSGKTEAALLWAAANNEKAARLFYVLPYQASMNAMVDRLKRGIFPQNHVTVQHSRATLKYYRDHMEADGGADPKAAAQAARQQRDRARLNVYPVQVFSPYQMLKAAFALKGYETLLLDYTDALFIFDEIHAYDPERLALIITFMGWLSENVGARFFVMTATLPDMVRLALHDALPGCNEIIADRKTFDASQRHTVHLHDGDLMDHLDRVIADYGRGESALVVCNQVARAQDAYRSLEHAIPESDLCLLHGRFNTKDRGHKEAWLRERVGVRADNRQPTVFVATQVVEVSLDVDFDTLYTDPAPLDALLQRFGRVNRGRNTSVLRPVHVFREPLGEDESLPYDHELVARSLDVLHDGAPIDEAQVSAMLDQVYDAAMRDKWQTAYDKKRREFLGILQEMQPYRSASPDEARRFYELFDGSQVLPFDCTDDYDQAKEAGGFLSASQYLVNVPHWRVAWMDKIKRLDDYDDYIQCTTLDYSSKWGLNLNIDGERDTDE